MPEDSAFDPGSHIAEGRSWNWSDISAVQLRASGQGNHMLRPGKIRRRGIFVADALIALAVVMILMGALAVVVNGYARAAQRLQSQTDAIRIAEVEMQRLQGAAGAPPAPLDASATQPADVSTTRPGQITVTALSDAAPEAGKIWAEVRVKLDRGEAAIVGLIPAEAIAPQASVSAEVDGGER